MSCFKLKQTSLSFKNNTVYAHLFTTCTYYIFAVIHMHHLLTFMFIKSIIFFCVCNFYFYSTIDQIRNLWTSTQYLNHWVYKILHLLCFWIYSISPWSNQVLFFVCTQIALLLEYLNSDERQSIQNVCLTNLLLLAQKASHIWTKDHVETLCNFALKSVYDRHVNLFYICSQKFVLPKVIKLKKYPSSNKTTFCHQN